MVHKSSKFYISILLWSGFLAYAVLKSIRKKNLSFSSLEKNIFWSVSMEKENDFLDLNF